jgi:hypothetical protein
MFAALAAAAQTGAAANNTDNLTAPPDLSRERLILCGCASEPPAETVLNGLVVDAELTLGPDRRSTNDRQATVFEKRGSGERFKVFHNTSRSGCGVTFDYGKNYSVPARKTEDGVFETNFCLVRNGDDGVAATEEASSE